MPRREASQLSPARRQADMARVTSQQLDVLVIGGGVTGAGAALDAATRGLSVGLVEAQDWAAGTSSRSSKLVHGGLRYLKMLDFGLVREALSERALLLEHVAPHLVRPVPILFPLKWPVLERAYVGAGVALYDLLGLAQRRPGGVPHHRHLSREQALRLAPGLRGDVLTGAVMYWDAQVDDARFVVELVRTAAAYGARPVSRAEAVSLLSDGGRVRGATVRDVENGEVHEARARVTILATGPWTEETEALAGTPSGARVRPSKGAHVLVRRDKIDCSTGMVLRTRTSVLFVLPWADHWLIGTTDTDWPYGKARPLATAADVGYLLHELNSVLSRPLSGADIANVFAGLRPLISGTGVVRGPGEGRSRGAGDATAKLSREHLVSRPAPGLVVVSGGKYTTYRVMAADAVDAAVSEGHFHALPCRTRRVALLGARGWGGLWARRAEVARGSGLPLPEVKRLLQRYGALTTELLALLAARPRLAERLGGARPARYLRGEIVYAVTHEGARHLEDVVYRRARVAMEEPAGGQAFYREIGEVMAPLLGWDQATLSAEVQDCERQVDLAQQVIATRVDDAGAAAASAAVPTLLPLP